jgi:hypothetical protein
VIAIESTEAQGCIRAVTYTKAVGQPAVPHMINTERKRK